MRLFLAFSSLLLLCNVSHLFFGPDPIKEISSKDLFYSGIRALPITVLDFKQPIIALEIFAENVFIGSGSGFQSMKVCHLPKEKTSCAFFHFGATKKLARFAHST